MKQEEVKDIIEVLKRLADSENPTIDLAKRQQEKLLTCKNEQNTPVQWSINKSQFYKGKISLNCRLPNANINILRLDTAPVNQHTNPSFKKGIVPDWLENYGGIVIKEQAHLHVYVESFPSLEWVVPLSDISSFDVKSFENLDDIVKVIVQFARYIKLENELNVLKPLL